MRIVIALLLIIISIIFPPFLVIAIPAILIMMVKSGMGSASRGFKMMKESGDEIKETVRHIKAEKNRKKNSLINPENRTDKDNENLARLKAELARDREAKKKNRKK